LNLKRVPLDDNVLFSSAAMIIDEDLSAPKTVAVVLFSGGGNIIYLHNKFYLKHLTEIQVAAEEIMGETLRAHRIKVFMCEVLGVDQY